MDTGQVEFNRDNSIELVTSILLEYQIINTVDVNLEEKKLKVSFLIDGQLTDDSWLSKKKKILQSFNLFNKFEDREDQSLFLYKEDYQDLTRLNLIRKLQGSSKNELDFIIKVVQEVFSDRLLSNNYSYATTTKNTIDSLLEKISKDNVLTEAGEKYLGFIEDDKVLVFNKSNKN